MDEQQRYYSVEQLAEMFSVTAETVRRWIRDGELPAYRLRRRELRVSQEDLDAFLKSRRIGDGE
jgi:excisionase family DNA binding protein